MASSGRALCCLQERRKERKKRRGGSSSSSNEKEASEIEATDQSESGALSSNSHLCGYASSIARVLCSAAPNYKNYSSKEKRRAHSCSHVLYRQCTLRVVVAVMNFYDILLLLFFLPRLCRCRSFIVGTKLLNSESTSLSLSLSLFILYITALARAFQNEPIDVRQLHCTNLNEREMRSFVAYNKFYSLPELH